VGSRNLEDAARTLLRAAEQRISASVWRRRRALAAVARAAVVLSVAFAIALWGVGDLEMAVFASFTAMGLTGIADFGGDLRARALANLVTGAAAIGVALIGTAASEHPVVAPVVAAAAGFVLAFVGGLGGHVRAAARVLVIFLVLSIGVPGPVSEMGSRAAGIALAAGLAAVASVVL
jgi:hypothetical protein